MSSLPVGTTVKLEGLSSAEYNGKKGIIAVTAPDIAARGRVAVIVDGATLSFKRANVRRYFPSDDSDESDDDPPGPAAVSRAGVRRFALATRRRRDSASKIVRNLSYQSAEIGKVADMLASVLLAASSISMRSPGIPAIAPRRRDLSLQPSCSLVRFAHSQQLRKNRHP